MFEWVRVALKQQAAYQLMIVYLYEAGGAAHYPGLVVEEPLGEKAVLVKSRLCLLKVALLYWHDQAVAAEVVVYWTSLGQRV